MTYKRSNKRSNKRSKRSKRSKMRSKTKGLIYYKMSKCRYCKAFESELWIKVVKYCKKNKIKYHTVVREFNPELIPNNIKTYPSLVKYDKNMKTIVFKKDRTLNNIKNFLK